MFAIYLRFACVAMLDLVYTLKKILIKKKDFEIARMKQ